MDDDNDFIESRIERHEYWNSTEFIGFEIKSRDRRCVDGFHGFPKTDGWRGGIQTDFPCITSKTWAAHTVMITMKRARIL